MVTSKSIAPFCTSAKRFGKITVHPGLDPSGLYVKQRPRGCDPCLYHPKPLNEIFEINKNKKINKDPWRYKKELEEWAQNLGYRNVKILETRRWDRSVLGPAWHDVQELPKYEAACKNVGFGRTPRYKPSNNTIPGPGTYYKIVPYKAPYGPHSTRPTFDREEPCRFKDPCPKWSLAPNRYVILDKEQIDQKSKIIVSLRGPYDLFSGKRGTTIKRCSAATWPLALPGSLHKYDKSHFGTLNQTDRSQPVRGRSGLTDLAMAIRSPEDPSPAHYDTDPPKVFVQNKQGFNSSYDRPPGYQRIVVWPGVGRYSVKRPSCGILGKGHRHVFLSKEQRTIGAVIPQPMNSF